MHHRILPAVALCAMAALLAGGCSKSSPGPTMGTMKLQMTDSPGPYDAVNLVVKRVEVHAAAADSSGGWETLSADSATYDLLALRNGVFATLGVASLPAGHYTQLRLVLGDGSNVVVGGVQHPLVVPSGMESGLKLVGEFDVPAGGGLDLALDFDAEHSIVLTGAGVYMLHPTVRVMPFSAGGAIAGTVLPGWARAEVAALQGPDTVGTAMADDNGAFQISVLPAGSYDVGFHAPGFIDATVAGVNVAAGATARMDTVTLTYVPIIFRAKRSDPLARGR